MKKLLVTAVVPLLVLGLAVAASAAVDSAWVVQLRVAAPNGANSMGNSQFGCAAAQTYSSMPPNLGTAVEITCPDQGGSSPPRNYRDLRVALLSGNTMTWNLRVYAGPQYGYTQVLLSGWNPTGTAYDIDADLANVVRLYKGTSVVYTFGSVLNGTSAAPLFTHLYDIAPGQTLTDFRLVREPVGGSALAVAITNPTSSPTYSTNASTIDLSGTASGSVVDVTWSSDNGESGECTGTTSWSANGIVLQTGDNIITVTATDDAGGSASATLTVTYTPTPGTPPGIAISQPSTASTSSGPVSYTVTYTDATAVTLAEGNVTLNATGTASGTVAVSGSGSIARTVTISNITGDGTLGISIVAGTASNDGGTAPAAGPSATVSVSNALPGVVISDPSANSTTVGPITYTVTYVNATAVTLVAADVTLNTTGTANGTVAVSGSGNTTRTVTISSITGDGTLGISIAAGTASSDGGTAPAAGPSATFTVANTLPAISISAPSEASTTTGPVSYTVTYANATAVTLAAADVTLNTTGAASGTVAVTGSGNTTRTVTISSISGNGTLGISIAAGTASNDGGTALAAGPSATFSVTNTLPTISISAPSETSTRTGPVTYTVTYTGATSVTIAVSAITLNKTGTADGAVSVSATGGPTRTVTISDITGNGTLGISIAAGTASNATGSAASAGPSETFAVASVPALSISAPSASSTRTGPITYTLTYTGATAVTLGDSDITLNKTGTADGTASVSGTGTASRTVTISAITGGGTLGISIAAGTASNSEGSAPAAGPSQTFMVDSTGPTVQITIPTDSPQVERNCNTLDISGNASDASGIALVTCSLNGGAPVACTGTTAWSATGLVLNWGDNAIVVTGADAAGNTSAATLTVTCTDSHPGSDWQSLAMVSLPIVPDQTDPQQAIGPKLAGWSGYDPTPPGQYRDYSDPASWFEPPSATPGRGFWARFTGTPNVPCGVVPDQTKEAVIALRPGWNLIGCPFTKPMNWSPSAIQVDVAGTRSALIDSGFACLHYAWGWDPAAASYFLVCDPAIISTARGQLEPWQAYWLKAYAACDLILPPP